MVPADALVFNGDGVQVAVVDNGVAHFRKVTVARDFGTEVEVRDGIKPGDEVILKPAVTLADGSKVQPQTAPSRRCLSDNHFGASTPEAPMRSLVFMTAAMVLFGCGSTFGQTTSTPGRNTQTTRMTAPTPALTSPIAVPGTIPTLGAKPGSALGAIQLTPSTSATISAGALGTITTCPVTGINAAPSGIVDASSAVAMTGALATPPLPGATIPPNAYFAPSIMNGTCNPTISAQNLTEFFNNTAVAPSWLETEISGSSVRPSASTRGSWQRCHVSERPGPAGQVRRSSASGAARPRVTWKSTDGETWRLVGRPDQGPGHRLSSGWLSGADGSWSASTDGDTWEAAPELARLLHKSTTDGTANVSTWIIGDTLFYSVAEHEGARQRDLWIVQFQPGVLSEGVIGRARRLPFRQPRPPDKECSR